MPTPNPTRPVASDPAAPTPRLVLRPATVAEAVALIEAAAASGARVLVTDLPTDGLLLGRRVAA